MSVLAILADMNVLAVLAVKAVLAELTVLNVLVDIVYYWMILVDHGCQVLGVKCHPNLLQHFWKSLKDISFGVPFCYFGTFNFFTSLPCAHT